MLCCHHLKKTTAECHGLLLEANGELSPINETVRLDFADSIVVDIDKTKNAQDRRNNLKQP